LDLLRGWVLSCGWVLLSLVLFSNHVAHHLPESVKFSRRETGRWKRLRLSVSRWWHDERAGNVELGEGVDKVV
jgi:hypothetical protein